MKKKILLGLLAILILIQFKGINKVNPQYPAEDDFLNIYQPDKEIRNILKYSCYDCHSYETKYPWYTSVAPISWLISGHIKGAREEINFSKWASYSEEDKQHIIKDCAKEVESKYMPMKSYMWMHPEGKLTEDSRAKLVKFFKTLKA